MPSHRSWSPSWMAYHSSLASLESVAWSRCQELLYWPPRTRKARQRGGAARRDRRSTTQSSSTRTSSAGGSAVVGDRDDVRDPARRGRRLLDHAVERGAAGEAHEPRLRVAVARLLHRGGRRGPRPRALAVAREGPGGGLRKPVRHERDHRIGAGGVRLSRAVPSTKRSTGARTAKGQWYCAVRACDGTRRGRTPRGSRACQRREAAPADILSSPMAPRAVPVDIRPCLCCGSYSAPYLLIFGILDTFDGAKKTKRNPEHLKLINF